MLAFGAILSGAAPGVVADVLGITPVLTLAGNILSTAPLTIGVGLAGVVFAWGAQQSEPNWLAVWAGIGLVLWASLLAAMLLAGEGMPNLWLSDESGFFNILALPFRVLNEYVEIYGWPRYLMATVGIPGAALGAAYVVALSLNEDAP